MYIYKPSRILLQEQVKQFAKYINGRVLDVGSGTHNRYQHLFNFDEYIKMDIIEGKGVDIIGSADSIPFGNESFDSAVSTQVFEHLEFPEKAAQEIYRILKKRGYVLITVPQWNELHEEPHDYWRFTKFGARKIFERNGFETKEYTQLGGFFTTILQMKIRYLTDVLKLHKRPILGCIASQFFKILGTTAIMFDRLDKSAANKKHAIGWCFVFQKI